MTTPLAPSPSPARTAEPVVTWCWTTARTATPSTPACSSSSNGATSRHDPAGLAAEAPSVVGDGGRRQVGAGVVGVELLSQLVPPAGGGGPPPARPGGGRARG